MLKKFFIAAFIVLMPLIALADNPGQGPYYGPGSSGYENPISQGWGGGQTFSGTIRYVLIPLINQVIPVLGALALVLFFIGVIRYIRSEGDHSNRDEILWSLIALFVLFSLWGILRILTNTFLPGN